jgi:hypothetical protein
MSRSFFPLIALLAAFVVALPVCVHAKGPAVDVLKQPQYANAKEDPSGMKVYSGQVTRVSQSEYILQTTPSQDGDYCEAFFDFPVSLQEPFVIRLDVDYPAKDSKDTVEFYIGDNIFGYQPATAEYWNIFESWKQKKTLEINNKLKIKEYYFGRTNTFDITGQGLPSTKNKAYYFQIIMNHRETFGYNAYYNKDVRFGARVRSEKGSPKTAKISNLAILSSSDPLHAGRVKAAIVDIKNKHNEEAGSFSEYHDIAFKQSLYGGNSKAEILQKEKEYEDKWEKRRKQKK